MKVIIKIENYENDAFQDGNKENEIARIKSEVFKQVEQGKSLESAEITTVIP